MHTIQDVIDDTAIHVVGSGEDLGQLQRAGCPRGTARRGVMLSGRVRSVIGMDEDAVRQSVVDYWRSRFGDRADYMSVDAGEIGYDAVYASDSPGLLIVGYTADCPRPDLHR